LLYSLADQKFGAFADKFMKKAQQQMGVHVFMMIGYKNEKGEILRSKWVSFYIPCACLLTFNTCEQIGKS
jgi:hypothetical protein